MKHVFLHDYSKKRLTQFLFTCHSIGFTFIFNIRHFVKPDTIKRYFRPKYVMDLLAPIYKGEVIVVEVSEFIGKGTYESYGIKFVVKSDNHPEIQIIHYLFDGNAKNTYTVRKPDTMIASHVIYRENISLTASVNIVLSDCKQLGFAKAVKIISLCETCQYYDDRSYHMRCAVNPHLDNDVTFECCDYSKVALIK